MNTFKNPTAVPVALAYLNDEQLESSDIVGCGGDIYIEERWTRFDRPIISIA